jgi:uncharacterized membrane protein (UPF0127 family)
MRRILVLIAAVVVLAGCGDDGKPAGPERVVQVGDATVEVEVAADEASRQRGLGGRHSLGPDRGMLFVLADRSPAFWMKDMRFPLDIVWIDGERVVDVSANVPPPKGPNAPLPTYSPDRPADRALEVNAGWAARHGVGRGDAVRLPQIDGSG